MIIFLNIAQMEFKTINMSFLICMLGAKLLVFMVVSSLTLIISYPRNFGYAGSLSILSTQSNDFALGYPLIKSLYGDSKPEMLNYLSLMAPIQLLILNPLGIMMLEYHKSKQAKKLTKSQRRNKCNHCQNDAIRPAEQSGCAKIELDLEGAQTTSRAGITNENYSFRPDSTSFSGTQTLSAPGPARASSPVPEALASGSGSITSLALTTPPPRELHDDEDRPHVSRRLVDLVDTNDSVEYRLARHGGERLSHEHNTAHKLDVVSQSRSYCSATQSEPMVVTHPIKTPSCTCVIDGKSCRIPVDLGFLKALAMNPLIIASVVALITNLTHGPELPKFVTRVSNTIAASFAAPALFVVGTSMYGKFELLLSNPNDLLLSSVLVLTKVLVLPNLMRTLTMMIVPANTPAEEVPYLIDFSFLYGLLPTAPTACIIAKQYGILPDVISISMLLSTFASAPLMLAASAIINPANLIKPADIEKLISQTVKISSAITFSLAFLTIYAIWKSKDRLSYTNFVGIPEATMRRISRLKSDPTLIFLLLLAVSQATVGLGGIIWCFVDSGNFESPQGSALMHLIDGETDTLTSTSTPMPWTAEAMSESESVQMRVPITFPAPLSSSDPQIEPLPLHEPFETLQQPVHLDFGLKTIFAAQYVFSSSGLMMSRFVILCIILVMAAKQFSGHIVASKVSMLLAKIYVILGSSIVLWLIFDSDHSKRVAIEPSLPSENGALYVRLVFNVVFLCVAMPMFAIIIREDNKRKISNEAKLIESDEQTECSGKVPSSPDYDVSRRVSSLGTRRFLTSSASLNSNSSSAMTGSTNIGLSSSSTTPTSILPSPVPLKDSNNNNATAIVKVRSNQPRESLSIVLDCNEFNDNSHEASKIERSDTVDVVATIHTGTPKRILNGNLSKQYKSDHNSNHIKDQHQKQTRKQDTSSRHYEIDDSPIVDTTTSLRDRDQFQTSEFNRYSILIVFMLIDSMLNLTSITQKLIQYQPSGTFRQIEVISVALEFGQGLLTFLIYGTGRLFK